MAPDPATGIVKLAGPLLDIAYPAAPTVVQRAGLADVAPAPGMELALLGTLAAVVAALLVFILRSRRK